MAGSVVDSSVIAKAKYPEVLYPREFSNVHPLKGQLPVVKCWDPDKLSLPISHLSHITHDEQALQIGKDEVYYTFQSKKKVGKDCEERDGSPMGETFMKIEEDQYKRIPKPFPVFPGYISWWGIGFRDWYEDSTVERNLQDAISEIPYEVKAADYLRNPPSSKYGNNEFIFSWRDLIESYKESRRDSKSKEVYLRKAGTLHYKYEVCYVVMVVMQEDLDIDSIPEMPSMYDEPSFKHNGCINKDGKLIGEGSPSFRIKHPFSEMHGSSCNYEVLVFAFFFTKYFIRSLRCKKQLCRVENNVDHSFCTSTQQPPGGGKWVCPNKIKPPNYDF